MKQAQSLTVDGRAAYGTGTTKTQPVYKQERGQYVRDANGHLIVVGYRVRRHEYIEVDGVRVKTPSVSVKASKHPRAMSLAEKGALDKKLSELIARSLKLYTKIVDLNREVLDMLEEDEVDFEQARRVMAKFDKLVSATSLETDQASTKALLKLSEDFQRLAQRATAYASTMTEFVEAERQEIAEMASLISEATHKRKVVEKMNSLSVACLLYLADGEGVRAGKETRRTYAGYLRNHILVPTCKGRKAIGDLPVGGISKSDLQAFERSLYVERDGYRLNGDPLEIDAKRWLLEGAEHEMCEYRHELIQPQTAHKILHFLASVVEWCRQEPERWGITSSVNVVQAYKPIGKTSSSRRQGAPRTARFLHLVEVAEANGLEWMVPLMALVRITYRPSEARGLRWSDLSEVHSWDGRKRMAFTLRGTIVNAAGGEKWVPQGKTASAVGQTIEVPSYILTLLEKHRAEGCDYVVAPPKKTGKNASRRTKPFATKHDLEEGWRELKQLAGVPPKVDLYTLKHGLIAELLLQGVKPEVITLLTRHTTINMVMRVYASIQSGDLCDAIDTMHSQQPD